MIFNKKPIRIWGFSFGMSSREGAFVLVILILIGAFSYTNFISAFIRTHDTQRKNDLKRIAGAVKDYAYDFSYYPPASNDNKILACGTPESLQPCDWGIDSLRDIKDLTYPPYTPTLPRDPQAHLGKTYVYYSDSRDFYLFAALENRLDDEYNEKVASLEISCGTRICNFGIASSGRPEDFLGGTSATDSALPK